VTEGIGIRRNWKTLLVLVALLAWMTFDTSGVERGLRWLFPGENPVIYQRQTPAALMSDHLTITATASVLALVIGGSLGLLLLTPVGRRFRDVVVNLASFGQTLPTVAIIAMVVPSIGYGWRPVVLALVIYSILPIMLNVVAGVGAVPPAVVDAATGMGMSRRQRFWRVQMPMAAPVILGGVKNMLIINISAATVGAIVGAGGLGIPILAGIGQFNNALIIQGALPAALLALIVDQAL
jgi:osmoprotectant transport system permease protein